MNAHCTACGKDLGPFEPIAGVEVLHFCKGCRDNREKAMGRPDRFILIRRHPRL